MKAAPSLKPDCSACAALCCVVFAFDRSESFAIDKAAGEVCPNLDACNRCRVFDDRANLGFKGCITYDCHGAGQVITKEVFNGLSWRDEPSLTARMGAALSVLRRIHEQLLLLEMAGRLPLDDSDAQQLLALRQSLLAPRDGWTEAALASYLIDDKIKEVSLFLKRLRHLVASGPSARN